MFQKHKPVPVVFMVISVLYFIYVVNMGSSTMIGDEIGGDPGGMLLPLVLSIFMFISSVVIFFTDKKDVNLEAEKQNVEHRLFILTVFVAILYVVAMRPLGFILTTVLLIFTLTYFYLMGSVHRKDLGVWALGSVSSIAVLLIIYSIGRKITRSLLISVRLKSIPQWMGNPAVTVSLVLLIVVIWFIVFSKIGKKWFKSGVAKTSHVNAFKAGMLAVTTTELVYLIFRQMFLVELVRGLINW